MKNVFSVILVFFPIFLVCGFLNSGCSKNRLENNSETCSESDSENRAQNFSGQKTDAKIVCNTFPLFDWTREIADGAENLEIILIQKNGSDLHSFKPSAKDLIEIESCDLFVFVGGESDGWIESVNISAEKKLCLFDLDFPKITETDSSHGLNELYESDESHESYEPRETHGHFDLQDDFHGLHEFDEHVWLSLKNAKFFADSICRFLSRIVPEKSEIFEKNAGSYKNRLESLDEKFSVLFKTNGKDEKPLFVFCDRFPFSYFAKDYGLDCVSAFSGCSAETEASFERVLFLVEKLKSAENAFVFVLENSDRKLAETVTGNAGKSGMKIYELDSMQSVKESDIKNGTTYLSLAEKNYQVFEKLNLSK